MGTCFTKTEYVSGRQLNMKLKLKRHNSQPFLSSKDLSLLDIQNKNIKEIDNRLRQDSKCIHGTKGIQSRYNRWICRQQVSLCKDMPEGDENLATAEHETNHSSSLKSAFTSSSYTQEKFNHNTLVSLNGDYGKDLTKNELIQILKVRLQNSKCPINHQALSLENSEVQTPDMLKKYRPSKSKFGGFKSTNGNLVFSDKQKCPPPLFTNVQKNLAIEAWEKINHYIEKIGIKEFAKQFHYNSEILKTFPILHHHMSDIELTSQNYFVGPKTEDRICSHTIAIFTMLNGIIMELKTNDTNANDVISETLFKEGTKHFGYGCYLSSLELFGMMMVRSLVTIIKHEEKDPVKLKELEEAIFIFIKCVTFWLMEGMKYVKGRGVN